MSYKPKFKIGDIIYDSTDRSYRFRITKLVKKGEIVSGKWYDSTTNKTMPADGYVVEGYRSQILFMLSFHHEQFYELAEEGKRTIDMTPVANSDYYNGVCKQCNSPAYRGFNKNECSNGCDNPEVICQD